MKLRLSKIFLFISLTFLMACSEDTPSVIRTLSSEQLIPLPATFTPMDGYAFQLNSNLKIQYENEISEPAAKEIAAIFKEQLGLDIEYGVGGLPKNTIFLNPEADREDLGTEGYEINISERDLRIRSNGAAGLFYAAQTLAQLLPLEANVSEQSDSIYALGAGIIIDNPRYAFRGSMLDVARHFFDVATVKKYIDYLAMYKMNVLHLHLSDDQGWRIEIKSWPKLTEVGGSTQVGGGEGGFYTQEEYSEIVAYAAEKHITIIPEIDMPGHTNAALASYPELNCNGKATELYTGTQVGFSTLCTDKEVVYQFVDDVVKELAMLTPGPYIHVGGDESHVTEKPDYIKFINRVQEIVDKHGKQLVGWDEVTLGELSANAVAQYWASAENAKNAVDKNLKVIMSPAKKAYLDMKYDTTTQLGLKWAGLIEADTGYDWDPAALEEGLTDENILGVEAPLWAETITNLEEIEYLTFPRLPGYAEIAWTPQAKRNWEDYRQRLANQKTRFEKWGINYYASPKVPWK